MTIDKHLHRLWEILILSSDATFLNRFFKFFYSYDTILNKRYNNERQRKKA